MLLTEFSDFSEIKNLMVDIAQRASYINEREGRRLETLFTPKIVRFLPPYNPVMEIEYAGIV